MSETPQARHAARVVVVDDDQRVLLMRGGDPQRPEVGTWWFTPGGGVEAGESTLDAARRELFEETGFTAGDLGPVRFSDRSEFSFNGVTYDQLAEFYVLRTPAFEVDTSRWSAVERASVFETRWWDLAALRSTRDVVYLIGLLSYLDETLSAW